MSMATGLLEARLARLGPKARLALCAGLGAVAALGQAPWGLWPVTLIALAALYGMFRITRTLRQGLWAGWAAGTGYFLVSLNWIIEPFLVDVARHGWMAPFALMLMGAGLGLFWAIGWAWARGIGGGALAWIAAGVLTEALRGWLFTGFPWAQVGHIWIDTGLLGWASLGGALLLSGATLIGAVAMWHILDARRIPGALGLTALAGALVVGPMLTRAPEVAQDAPQVRLVQPNAPQDQKWDPDHIRTFFTRQLDYTAADARPDLIVWPETSVPSLLNQAAGALGAVQDAARGVPVVLGIQRLDGLRLYNSMILMDGQGDLAALYDKHHLVPFGEYIPFGDWLGRLGISGLAAQAGHGYSSGPGPQVIAVPGIGTALPLICYEGVFPRALRGAPGRADFLLLITNDAWFGQASGPYQHVAQARLRSVEQGLPMIRVANTGVSAMINAAGQITAQIGLGEAGWIDAPLPPPAPPTLYARMGDGPLVLLLLALGLGLSLRHRARGKGPVL